MNRNVIKSIAIALTSATLLSGCSYGVKLDSSEKRSLNSLTKVADGIYTMDCCYDYKIDEYLAANITTVTELDKWFTATLTHDIPTGDIPAFGCSSFTVSDTEGNHLFGRNYDNRTDCDSLIIRTTPEDGYASIGIVDLTHVNIGTHTDNSLEDKESLPLLLAAPWCICDGINEKGLGVSILELSDRHTVEDTDKDDLLVYSALRIILDRCASVDEAVDFLGSYDIYSPRPNSYHVFITDTSGHSVIVEWDNGEMCIVEDNAVTNFMLHKESITFDGDPRYKKLRQGLDGVNSMTSTDAMALLENVKQTTLWSAVYNLENFSVEVCFNTDYSKTYTFEGKIK